VTVRVTIHRKNVRDLEAIADYLLEDMGLPGFSTNAASPMGLCLGRYGRIQLTVEEQTLAMEKMLMLTRKYEGRINAQAGPLAQARDWRMMEQARCEGRDTIPGRGYLTGCGGPMSQMAVRADGVFVPCCQIPHVEMGRINRDVLEEMWQDHPELKKIEGAGPHPAPFLRILPGMRIPELLHRQLPGVGLQRCGRFMPPQSE